MPDLTHHLTAEQISEACRHLRREIANPAAYRVATPADYVDVVLEFVAPLIAGQVRQATADTIIAAVEQRAVTWATSEGWMTVRDVVAIARRAGDGDRTATT